MLHMRQHANNDALSFTLSLLNAAQCNGRNTLWIRVVLSGLNVFSQQIGYLRAFREATPTKTVAHGDDDDAAHK